jgi:hypothetical protein
MGLTPFEGRDVIATKVAITRAGDGLSKAMEVEPDELDLGTTVVVVLECEVDKVRFEPVADTEALTRIHTLKAGTATIVESKVVAKALDDQRRRIEQAKGVERLPMDE